VVKSYELTAQPYYKIFKSWSATEFVQMSH